jgi:hypothetical protein
MTTLREELKKYEFTDFEDDVPIVSEMFHKDDIIKAVNAVLDDCEKTVNLIVGDGILECENCGYGFAPLDDIEIHGSYKRFQECIGIAYAVSNEAQQKFPKPNKPDWESYHKLLKELEIQRSIGLPDDPKLKCLYDEQRTLNKKLWAEDELDKSFEAIGEGPKKRR